MHRAIVKRICLVVAVVHFSSLPEWVATPKEKPLLRVHEVTISWGFTRDSSTLEVSANGRISLKGTLVSGFRAKKVTLSAEEIQALRNFLNSEPVQHLQDFYPCSLTTDGGSSMKIEVTPSANTKRIALCNLELESKNSKIYPAAIHDLVCKIYGLKQRAGVRYRPTTRIEPDGTKSDDTWCDSASLELIAKPGPAESGNSHSLKE